MIYYPFIYFHNDVLELEYCTEQFLLSKRVFRGYHRCHQRVLFSMSFTESHQVSCCFRHLHTQLNQLLLWQHTMVELNSYLRGVLTYKHPFNVDFKFQLFHSFSGIGYFGHVIGHPHLSWCSSAWW